MTYTDDDYDRMIKEITDKVFKLDYKRFREFNIKFRYYNDKIFEMFRLYEMCGYDAIKNFHYTDKFKDEIEKAYKFVNNE